MKWLKRIKEYYKNKELADKCGLEIKDICKHEPSKSSCECTTCDCIKFCTKSSKIYK